MTQLHAARARMARTSPYIPVALLSAADVFLLPSAQKSFGLAQLEAMACQVPVVASRVGGIPEVVEDGVSGFLHDPDDLDGMARSATALRSDEALHRRMPAAASGSATERFCDSTIVPVYEAYLSRDSEFRLIGIARGLTTVGRAIWVPDGRRARP